ncbi:peptidase S66 [Desulfoluna limicola]|uniref:Peptidase S66 n=1 Tax=Desulfoluna limicola TaxID=2810562 RepID=A0ABM7PLZ3_9BACT|nr:LD-carboxypeptidase [Desulfoluna limicola]BCS98541.1 peptidase S66 [Desulfoluna limicola]
MFPLLKNARIGVVAPSGVVDPEKCAKGMARIKALGWEVEADDGVLASRGYLAGGEEERKASLIRVAGGNPGLMVAARGGYGAMRLLPSLSSDELLSLPLFMGFSDATALLVRLVGLGRVALHGPTVQSLATACPETLEALEGLLRGGDRPNALGGTWTTLVDGEGEGTLSGGNLATLAHLCGTPYQPDFSGCILALEDLHEAPYRMDRALTQMRLAGVFSGVVGVMVGECLHCGGGEVLDGVFRDIFAPLEIPVVTGGRFGHGSTNLPMVFGERVALSTETGFRYV